MPECRLRVKRRSRGLLKSLPLHPGERTSPFVPGMSEKCHNQTHAPHQTGSLRRNVTLPVPGEVQPACRAPNLGLAPPYFICGNRLAGVCSPQSEPEGAAMKVSFVVLATLLFSTNALAQGAPPKSKDPSVGAKPLVQVKQAAPERLSTRSKLQQRGATSQ